MGKRLYFNLEELVRLKRRLGQLEEALSKEEAVTVFSLFTVRRSLAELMEGLSVHSGTREILEMILFLTSEDPIGDTRQEKCLKLIDELKTLYHLDAIHYHLCVETENVIKAVKS